MNHIHGKIVVMTGGGTGGHVYPALPLIRKLKAEACTIYWIGSAAGIEKDLADRWDLSYKGISTGKLRRYFSFRNFTDIFRILLGFFQSLIILGRLKPVFLFSKGGFVSVPPVLAAWCLGIPVYTHDSDVDPGLATRINSRFARKIFVAYHKSLKFYPAKLQHKIVVSGNPVRSEFSDESLKLPASWLERIGSRKVLAVIGGSLGAVQLNSLVRESLAELGEDIFVIHQMGEKNYTPSDSENYMPLPYINEELPALFRKADLAFSRSGAGTLWELAAAGTPALLLPLAAGSRGDQIRNAAIFGEQGAAEVLPESVDKDLFVQSVRKILDNQDILSKMKQAAAGFVKKPAEDIILSSIMDEETK